jgi:hypothetical protein
VTCVGRVAYIVKAQPRSATCGEAVSKLGLPLKPQRFAIVDAFVVQDVQNATKNLTLKDAGMKEVARALVKAGLIRQENGILHLLKSARESAPVLAMGKDARVHLRGTDPEAGVLKRLAIPLSSNCASWCRTTDNWSVAAVCRIDPRKVKLQMNVDPGPMQAAVNRISNTKLYFVHTYSKSNSRVR